LNSVDGRQSASRAGGEVCELVLGSRTRKLAAVICILLTSAFAQARIRRSQGWAENQFDKAESQREALLAEPEQARTRQQYETVIAAYRRIVLEAPISSKADGSAFEVAELTAEMARIYKDDAALFSAVREYKFLRKEYPSSKHRIEALLAIGVIYKNDLGDVADGQSALEDLVRQYPNSQSAQKAREELGSLHSEESEEAASRESVKPTSKEAKKAQRDDSSSAKSNDLVQVTAVEHWSTPEYTRVTVDLDQDVEFESQRIDSPDRIFFDLKNAYLPSALKGKSFDVDDGLVKKVRVAQFKPGKARIVIETDGNATYSASLLLSPPRLVIDVHSDSVHSGDPSPRQPTTATTAKVQKESEPRTVKVIPAEEKPISSVRANSPKKVIVEAGDSTDDDTDTPPQKPVEKIAKTRTTTKSLKHQSPLMASAREAQPTSSGDRSLIRALGLKIGKIVIDPGHGGHDTGTIGPNGLLEKDLVLDVSRRLGRLLEARLGADVVFTRRDDTFIPLETRTSIANQEQADLFVSVHANSSHDPDARGVETYYLNFTSSPEALEVAARENAASDKDIHELQDLVKKIALREKIDESREFASDVQESLHSGLATKSAGIRDRGVKKAPFVVLIGANMPSILAEISFISNPGDEKRLKGPEYRQRIAESLYRGISRYVNGLGGVKVASKIEKASTD
jgi:N-acetylmuramoyl-L-alanine amidase